MMLHMLRVGELRTALAGVPDSALVAVRVAKGGVTVTPLAAYVTLEKTLVPPAEKLPPGDLVVVIGAIQERPWP